MNALLVGIADKVWPEFELDKNQHGRTDPAECRLDGPAEIERGVKNSPGGIFLASKFKAGASGGGDHALPVGMLLLDPCQQGLEQVDLSNTYRV